MPLRHCSTTDRVKKTFRDDVKVATTALVASLHPPESKSKLVDILDTQSRWKDNSDEVIEVMRDAAVERRTVEHADTLRSTFCMTKNKEEASSNFSNAAKTSGGGKPQVRGVNIVSFCVYRRVFGLQGTQQKARTYGLVRGRA